MKKYIFLAVFVLCVSLYTYFNGSSKPEHDVNVLVVGSECDYVPNSWEENVKTSFNVPIANHKGYYADGYDIQMAKLIAEKLGKTIEVKKIAWNDLIPAVNKGEIDVIFSSMLDTEERKKLISFTIPYEHQKTEYGILVDSIGEYFAATSLTDFKGAKIVGERGTRHDEVIDQIPGVIHMKPVESVQAMVNSVINGDADGTVIDIDTGHFYEITNKGLTMIKFPAGNGFSLGFSGVCAGVKKGNTDLINKMNVVIDEIKYSERMMIMSHANSRVIESSH